MIDKLKRVFNKVVKEDVEMQKESQGVELALVNEAIDEGMDLKDLSKVSDIDTASFENELSQLKSLLSSKSTDLELALTQIKELKSSLQVFESEKLLAEKLAKEVKLNARKEKLEAAVGSEIAKNLLSSTETLDDVVFESIVQSLNLNLDKEQNQSGFKEIGVSADADLSKIVPESEEEKLLRKKYEAK